MLMESPLLVVGGGDQVKMPQKPRPIRIQRAVVR